jgi:hypothetical protein
MADLLAALKDDSAAVRLTAACLLTEQTDRQSLLRGFMPRQFAIPR